MLGLSPRLAQVPAGSRGALPPTPVEPLGSDRKASLSATRHTKGLRVYQRQQSVPPITGRRSSLVQRHGPCWHARGAVVYHPCPVHYSTIHAGGRTLSETTAPTRKGSVQEMHPYSKTRTLSIQSRCRRRCSPSQEGRCRGTPGNSHATRVNGRWVWLRDGQK